MSSARRSQDADGHVERFDPGSLHGALVEAEHLSRYLWATRAVEGRAVLDAGCGEGYGCRLHAEVGQAARCVGVDVDAGVIEAARQTYSHVPEIEFSVADVAELPFENDEFDIVTCFETIEHLSAQEHAIAELARVLRPGGLLLISSPNKGVYPPGNPFHERELTAEQFEALLSRSFADVRLLRQHNWILSAVLDDRDFASSTPERIVDLAAHKIEAREPGAELYTLAVCSQVEATAPSNAAVITHGLDVRRWVEELERRWTEVKPLREALALAESRLLELRDARSIEMARLERQVYWLERGRIDLDAWMQRRPMRIAFRALGLLLRTLRRLRG